MDFFSLMLRTLVIIYDDLDLPPGKIRFRQKGSAGGHNGIKSTIAHLGLKILIESELVLAARLVECLYLIMF